jgi:hypothetical protein
MGYYPRSIPGISEEEEIIYSGTSDISAYIKSFYRDTSDLTSSIIGDYAPLMNLRACISGWDTGVVATIYSSITPVTRAVDTLYAYIRGWVETSTEEHRYETVVLGVYGGYSTITRLLSKRPDLYASVHGFVYSELTAIMTLTYREHSDLHVSITSFAGNFLALLASIQPLSIEDFTASINTIPPEDILGSLTTIPPYDLSGIILSIPPRDLTAFIGGHLPVHLTASLLVNLPKDLFAYIISGYSGTKDLSGSIAGIGDYSSLSATIRTVFSNNTSNLTATICSGWSANLYANVYGRAETDLTATIYSVYSADLFAKILGYDSEVISDIPASIKSQWSSYTGISAIISGWKSAHTTDFPEGRSKATLPLNTIILTAFGGFSIFRTSLSHGDTPDLHATLNIISKLKSELKAYIVVLQRADYGITASINSVTKKLIRNYVQLNFVNASFITASVIISSGYLELGAALRGIASVSTGTAADAYWSKKEYNFTPILASTTGLLILNLPSNSEIFYDFVNYSNSPDLWARIHGWRYSSISASISSYPSSDLLGTLSCVTLDRLSDLCATLSAYATYDIGGSISSTGGFSSLGATLAVGGLYVALTSSIYPYRFVDGSTILEISTIPYTDLRATINYSGLSYGTILSEYRPLSGIINSFSRTFESLSASIHSTTQTLKLNASIVGLNLIRSRILNIIYRTRRRSYSDTYSSITGVGSEIAALYSTITGLHNLVDLSASITSRRYLFPPMDKKNFVEVYHVISGNARLVKEINIRFNSGVRHYVYDAIAAMLYKSSEDRWTISLKAIEEAADFFDLTSSKTEIIDSLVQYSSVDEAIRAAIDVLSIGRRSEISASITATGGYLGLYSSIVPTMADRESYLYATISQVEEVPFLTAFIYAYGSWRTMSGYITGIANSQESLSATLQCMRSFELSANITGTA